MNSLNQSTMSTGILDSCLVMKYSNANVALNFHADDESEMDQNTSICILSLGPSRVMDFCRKKDSDKNVIKSLTLESKSLTIMKPGTQRILEHRIKKGKPGEITPRFSLSFRKVTDKKIIPKPSMKKMTVNASESSECSDPGEKISTNRDSTSKPNAALLFGTSITRPLNESKITGQNCDITCII